MKWPRADPPPPGLFLDQLIFRIARHGNASRWGAKERIIPLDIQGPVWDKGSISSTHAWKELGRRSPLAFLFARPPMHGLSHPLLREAFCSRVVFKPL